MKKFFIYLLFFFTLSGFVNQDTSYRKIKNSSFTTGEELKYRVHYGFINAGTAVMKIANDIHYINNRPCYKVDVLGRSTGVFDVFTRIRDTWGAYVDTSAIVPQKAYRYIEEGKYRKFEITEFDHARNEAEMIWLDKVTKKPKERKSFQTPNNVQDIVSGFYFLRTIDYSKFKIGSIISLDAFFDEETYDFRIIFSGREKIKTDVGEINALILTPIVPENKFFSGENAVTVWVSDDSNRIPLKVKANLVVGAVEIDITSYKNTLN